MEKKLKIVENAKFDYFVQQSWDINQMNLNYPPGLAEVQRRDALHPVPHKWDQVNKQNKWDQVYEQNNINASFEKETK